MVLPPKPIHPKGEPTELSKQLKPASIEIDTFEGKVHVEWEPGASVTPMGQLPFFIQFLKTGCRFEPWVEDCPIVYTSNNAPKKVNVLGSFLLSILSGHKRYAHISTLTGEGVNSKLLGMTKVVSDDSARGALTRMDEAEGVKWLQNHLQQCYEPLLKIPWIMDVDVTIKTIYGNQEGAVKGYNPHKQGRPSHTYHSYMMANLKLILEVEVQPGNQGNSAHSLPGLMSLLNRLPKECWPEFVRGDCDWGSDRVMTELEQAGCGYLFKMKKSKNVKKAIHHAHYSAGWTRYDNHWEGKEFELKLDSWATTRRIIIVRRRLPKKDILLLENIKRCRFISRMVALIYNWWTLYVRLSNPDSHRESITSRPLLMSAIGKMTESSRQKKISITSQHSLMKKIQEMQTNLCDFFDSIKAITPQLPPIDVWCRILTRAVSKFLMKGQVITPIRLINTS